MGDLIDKAVTKMDTSSPQSFVAYLIEQALGDPRTKAMIGCGIRWLLHGAGVALAARPVGHLFQSAASNSDWIMLAAGVVLSAGQLVWGLYQKWRVDQKLAHKDAIIAAADAKDEAPTPPLRLPTLAEILPADAKPQQAWPASEPPRPPREGQP